MFLTIPALFARFESAAAEVPRYVRISVVKDGRESSAIDARSSEE